MPPSTETPPWPSAGLRRSAFRSERARQWTRDWIERSARASVPPFESVFVETSIGRTHLLRGPEAESGTDVIAFPGYGTNSAFWCVAGSVAPVARARRLWIADVPGHPGLSAGWAPRFGPQGYVRWVEEVMDGLALERVAVMGVSLGGMISMEAAAHLRDRVDRAVLLAPAGFVPPVPPARHVGTFLRFRYRTSRETIGGFYRHLVLGPRQQVEDRVQEEIEEFFLLGAGGFANRSRLPLRLSDRTLRSVEAPIALVVGEDDPVFSATRTLSRARRLVRRLDVAEVVSSEGHGLELSHRAMEIAADFLARP